MSPVAIVTESLSPVRSTLPDRGPDKIVKLPSSFVTTPAVLTMGPIGPWISTLGPTGPTFCTLTAGPEGLSCCILCCMGIAVSQVVVVVLLHTLSCGVCQSGSVCDDGGAGRERTGTGAARAMAARAPRVKVIEARILEVE